MVYPNIKLLAFANLIHYASTSPLTITSNGTNSSESGNGIIPTHYLIITGDSYTTTGYNATLSPQPSPQHPLGNPAYPGETFSGGENWVDIVVVNRSRRSTVAFNYAVGGNVVNASRTQLTASTVPKPIGEMIQQVDELESRFHNKRDGKNSSKIVLTRRNNLFISWFGINDIFQNGIFTDRETQEAKAYLSADIGDMFGQMDRVYQLGSRQFFTILVPPLERLPVVMALDKSQKARNLTEFWNKEVHRQNRRFIGRHRGHVKSTIYDPGPIFNLILDNPEQYGAPNNTCLSYPEGEPCLWHDFIHPGLVIQRHLGEHIYKRIARTGFGL